MKKVRRLAAAAAVTVSMLPVAAMAQTASVTSSTGASVDLGGIVGSVGGIVSSLVGTVTGLLGGLGL